MHPSPFKIKCNSCEENIWVIPPDIIYTKLIREEKSSSKDMRKGNINCPICNTNNDLYWNRLDY